MIDLIDTGGVSNGCELTCSYIRYIFTSLCSIKTLSTSVWEAVQSLVNLAIASEELALEIQQKLLMSLDKNIFLN